MALPILTEDLAKRILQSETRYFISRISSIGERAGNPEGVEIRHLGQTAAFYIKTMPWGLFNSVKGFTRDDTGSGPACNWRGPGPFGRLSPFKQQQKSLPRDPIGAG